MSEIERAVIAVQECATRLRSVIGAVAATAAPDELARIIRLLGDAQHLHSELEQLAEPKEALASPMLPDAAPVPAPKLRPRKEREYPRFCLEADALTKVGWSRKSAAEYEHKAPKSTVATVWNELGKCGKSGRQFRMDVLLPLTEPATGAAIPAYQAYVAVAWLKASGLVRQHGRKGYTITRRLLDRAEFEREWATLQTRT